MLTACGADLASWCLGDQVLDVGDVDFLAAPALADFDADGAVESNTDELTGLAGTTITVLASPDPTRPAVVLTLNGTSYRP
ncbi:hypothetical protein [Nocardioides ungokensis]|uniref:hypothetical protein n=1 Tax=Nocardioides ungokensis TaxID=1643322 RepID=UPI0015DE8AA1|nr:hypothetical protein [Nocardioides ungokensis]